MGFYIFLWYGPLFTVGGRANARGSHWAYISGIEGPGVCQTLLRNPALRGLRPFSLLTVGSAGE